jgi:hypothetical protein
MANRPNVVIFAYPGFAGGKFLINCLGLSDSCCFQDINLVSQQLNHSFTPQHKLTYLLSKLSDAETWQDLGLGDWQLFGVDWHQLTDRPELFMHDKLMFATAHARERLTELINKFPRSPRVYFINNQQFLDWRFNNNTRQGALYKDYVFDQNELITCWDADDFLTREICIDKIKMLYDKFALPDFDQHLIKTYYDKYILTLEKLKHDSSN